MKTVRLLSGVAVLLFMAIAPLGAEAHKGHAHKHRHAVYTPHWVPNHIIRTNTRHVYFPAYGLYFDRWNGTFIYSTRSGWMTSNYLPYELRGVSLARAHKVGLAINSPRPYVYHTRGRTSYRRYYRNAGHSYSFDFYDAYHPRQDGYWENQRHYNGGKGNRGKNQNQWNERRDDRPYKRRGRN